MMRMLALMLALLWSSPSDAHKPSDSYVTLAVEQQRINGQWHIALRDLDLALGLDGDGDRQLTWDEIRGRHFAIAAYAMARLEIAGCPLLVSSQQIDYHTDGAYAVLHLGATCAFAVDALHIRYRLFAELDPQHKGLFRISHAGIDTSAIFDPDHAQQTIALGTPSMLRQFGAYLRHGAWHIWIGFDHILFLLSLLLPAVWWAGRPADSFRAPLIDVFKIVTAFTLAHSLTLSLASLGLLALPSRWVETAIAASVAAAALNNIFPLLQGKRALAAFVFGLVHGLGFAAVLGDLGLPPSGRVLGLLGFNAGVELGQLAIVGAFLPLAYGLRRTWLYRQVVTGGSAMIALVAAIWCVERALDLRILTMWRG